MKALTIIAITVLIGLSAGCSTITNDRMQSVEFTAAERTAFTVTSKEGRTVSGFTPAMLVLDSAVGPFECERYTVTANGKTQTVETTIQPSFWAGAILLDGGLIDMIVGEMCKLPGRVSL